MRIAICKINERVFAFEDRCSHEDFPLSRGELESNERFCITCALHGSKFDLESGKPLNLPAVLPIKVFKTEVKGDKVIVILDE
jgi:3-phenylpropionate/trans-cinnamate dioxygenase ferredoxin subunit